MLLSIHPDNPDPRKLKLITECLLDGGLIIYPTDTVYGMGCDFSNNSAIEKLCRIKGIKPNKANFSFICSDLSHISEYAKPFTTNVYKLMRKCLPGAFTFILNATSKVPKMLNNNRKTIGIRIPDNNIALSIVAALGNPIISTSLKLQDEINEYPTDAELIYEEFHKLVDIVVDGGAGNAEPSTVIDCTENMPQLIRQGAGILPFDLA
jgi:tRNA threonylcarbamoyl adenosine modification protein (Sua5/YciO/YrdC/YwlC family)